MSKPISLGKKFGDMVNIKSVSPEEEHYPDLCLDGDDPRLLDIPDKGKCVINYRIASRTHREEKDGDGKKKHSCSLRLEVQSIEPPEGKSYKKKDYGNDVRKNMNDYFKDK